MGAFYTNYQVRSESTSEVVNALRPLVKARAYMSPPKNGWITVYDEASDEQSDVILRELATGLSQALNTAVFAFVVHDSDVLLYWLFQSGKLVDEFDSDPEYFGHRVTEKMRAGLQGKTEALLPLCRAGTTAEEIDAVIHDPEAISGMADEMLSDLAELLGMDDGRTALGFRYFEEEGEEMLPDADQFEPIGKGAERKVASTDPAAAAPPMPDPFGVAIGMLAQSWAVPDQAKSFITPELKSEIKEDEFIKQLRARFDRTARDLLKKTNAPGRPGFDELKIARDKGPEALAELLARFAPDQMTDIAVGTAANRGEAFIHALIERGLNPNAKSIHGITPLEAAAKHGRDSKIYLMLKAAAENAR